MDEAKDGIGIGMILIIAFLGYKVFSLQSQVNDNFNLIDAVEADSLNRHDSAVEGIEIVKDITDGNTDALNRVIDEVNRMNGY